MIEDESEENGRSTLSASLQAGGFHSAAGIVCPFFSGRPRAIPRGGTLVKLIGAACSWHFRIVW